MLMIMILITVIMIVIRRRRIVMMDQRVPLPGDDGRHAVRDVRREEHLDIE